MTEDQLYALIVNMKEQNERLVPVIEELDKLVSVGYTELSSNEVTLPLIKAYEDYKRWRDEQ